MSDAEPGLVRLAGDASTRRFYRRPTDGVVVMDYGHALDASGEAWLAVRRYLADLGVPVPAVVEVDREAGRIVMEDLGDITLEQERSVRGRDRWLPLYERAVDIIRTLQEGGRQRPDRECPAFSIVHDRQRLMYELGFFREHFLGGLLGHASALTDVELARALEDLADAVASQPRALCHRDFHSRNLMVIEARLVVIDFQDARIGPRTYDLASLLRDSYVELPEGVAARLVDRFAGGVAPAELADELRTAAIQRNLKALGTFGYMVTVRGADRYRDAIPRTLHHLGAALAADPRHGPLRGALERFLPAR